MSTRRADFLPDAGARGRGARDLGGGLEAKGCFGAAESGVAGGAGNVGERLCCVDQEVEDLRLRSVCGSGDFDRRGEVARRLVLLREGDAAAVAPYAEQQECSEKMVELRHLLQVVILSISVRILTSTSPISGGLDFND